MTSALSEDASPEGHAVPAGRAVPENHASPEDQTADSVPVHSSPLRLSPSRLRPYLAAVPESGPPYDDEKTPARRRSTRPVALQRTIETQVADWTVPSWSHDTDIGITKTSSTALPVARDTAVVLARALVEAMAGLRQVGQLSAHCSPEVYAGLRRRVRPGGVAPRLMSVRACQPADGVAEASAVFRRGKRAAAMAFRMQGIDGRWRVTALQVG